MSLRLLKFCLLLSIVLNMTACQLLSSDTQNTLCYFDQAGHSVSHAVAGGSYRKLLQTQTDGFLVQNFYTDTNHKLTDPFVIQAQQDLQAFIPSSIDGAFTRWYDNGQKAEIGHYQRGQKNGQFIEWNKQGSTLMEMTFINDLPHGRATLWYDHGSKYIEGQYSYGSESGVWYIRYPTGQIKLTILFSAGKIISAKDGNGKAVTLDQQNLLKMNQPPPR